MTKAILILATVFATWMMWPEISHRFSQRVDALPSLPTLPKAPKPSVTDPDIIYHGAKQWDPRTAPTGYEKPVSTPKVKMPKAPHGVKVSGQGDGGCNRILPNSGKCDALQYHSGSIHTPSNGIASRDLL